MNLRLALSVAMVSMFYLPVATLARHHEPTQSPPHSSPHLSPPTFLPTVCNCSGNYPSDGASATFTQLPGKGGRHFCSPARCTRRCRAGHGNRLQWHASNQFLGSRERPPSWRSVSSSKYQDSRRPLSF
jgi:hypothetical protein